MEGHPPNENPMPHHTTPPAICLVLSEHLTNAYLGPLTRGAVLSARMHGTALLLYSPLEIRLSRRVIPLGHMPLLPPGADGYIVTPYITDDVVEYCARNGAPVLTFAGVRSGLPAVVPDNRGGARAATEHLLAHGRRRIVHLRGVAASQEAAERLAGYREALEAAGLPFDEALVAAGEFQVLSAEASIDRLLRAGVAFDAVFAANDLGARGAMNALGRAGLRVPDDVAVIGFDDSRLAATLHPPLTSVRQSAFQIGWEAVRVLAAHQRGEPIPPQTLVPTQLITRESCGCRPGATAAREWPAAVAEALGAAHSLVITPAEVVSWSAPLRQALDRGDDVAAALERATHEAAGRGWHVPALRPLLDAWRASVGAAGAETAATAFSLLGRQLDERERRSQHARVRRISASTYVVDVLFEYGVTGGVDAVLRYIVANGPNEALGVQRGPAGQFVAQRVVAGMPDELWEGEAVDFPPPGWLAAGDVLLLMPMDAGPQQQVLLGVIERTEQEHLDLDDLLLRSINTYRSITVLNETLRELDAARSVQLSLLPRDAPRSEDYDIAGAARAARQVGGDLYGYYVRPSGALALALGDVAGKGMPAALLMSACVTALAGVIPAGLAPSLTLSQIHQMLQPSVGRAQNAAVCLAYLDGPRVRLANAGAIAPMLCAATGVRAVDVGGLPLGTPLSEVFAYREVELRLEPGDMLILSSDGIVEAMNERRELYGFERFVQAITAGPRDSAQAMMAHLFADVAAFIGDSEVHDDMAIVVARYCGV
jgi:LacI family transcriptional regulator